jgi:hypothetical protein
MRSLILPSQEGSTFHNQMLRKLEKTPIVTPPLASPFQKLVCFFGVMPLPLPSMDIHFDYNFTKKKVRHHLHIQKTNNFKKQG